MATNLMNHAQFVEPVIRSMVQLGISPTHPFQAPIAQVLAAKVARAVETGTKPSIGAEAILSVERDMKLNPQQTLTRYFRTVLLGGEADGKVVTFSPQKDVIPMRLVVPSTEGDREYSSLQAGLSQYFASNGAIQGYLFNAFCAAALIRPIYTRVGQDITMRADEAPTYGGYTLLCADMSATGRHAPVGELRPMGFKVTLAPDETKDVEIKPQLAFRVRKLSLLSTTNPNPDGLAPINLTRFLVGVDPQFLSAKAVCCETFDARVPWEVWLDADEAQVGQTITMTFHNSSENEQSVVGAVEGDVA